MYPTNSLNNRKNWLQYPNPDLSQFFFLNLPAMLPEYKPIAAILLCTFLLSCVDRQPAEQQQVTDPVANLTVQAGIRPDITYREVDGLRLKLDVVVPRLSLGEAPWWEIPGESLKPALLYIHGGGWVEGEKETRFLGLLPYVARGWVVININYRLAGEAVAPAAIEDCREALHWVVQHANELQIDTSRIVVSGESAGGHLALMTGLLQAGDSLCNGTYVVEKPLKVAAIINWYGVTDFTEERLQNHTWVKDLNNRARALRSLSPLNYLSPDAPPILTIHGDADPVVDPEHARKLHQKLETIGADNRLIMIPGKKHGNFSGTEQTHIFEQIWSFLEEYGVKTTVE